MPTHKVGEVPGGTSGAYTFTYSLLQVISPGLPVLIVHKCPSAGPLSRRDQASTRLWFLCVHRVHQLHRGRDSGEGHRVSGPTLKLHGGV